MIRTSRGTISLSRLFAAVTTLGLAWLVTPVPVFAQNAFITNSGDNTVSVIDTTKNTVVATIPVGKTPFGVAVSPDNKTVYITNSGDNTVSVIEAAAFTVIATIPVGTNPVGVAVTPDGKTVYVTNEGDGTVSVINTATNTVTGSAIDVDCPLTEVDCGRATGNKPTGIAVTPDGNKVFVGNLGGYYSIIATATNTVTSCLCFGPFPVPTSGVAVSPDGSVVFFVALGTENVFIVLYGGGSGTCLGSPARFRTSRSRRTSQSTLRTQLTMPCGPAEDLSSIQSLSASIPRASLSRRTTARSMSQTRVERETERYQ